MSNFTNYQFLIMRHLILFFLAIVFIFPNDAFSQKKRKRNKKAVEQKAAPVATFDFGISRSPVFNKSFTGFALYDPETGKMLYEYNSDKYFTPASNTKILTLFTGLQLLGDSIPALQYKGHGDMMVFWGTGDPSFLNPFLSDNNRIYDFLKNRPETLLFCPANFRDHRYGEGWMWDDYPYVYQPEKSPFPVYSNLIHFAQNDTTGGLKVTPAFLKNKLIHDPTLDEDDDIGRAEFKNDFSYNNYTASGAEVDWYAPFRATPEFIVKILSDTLHRPVHLIKEKRMPPVDAGVLYSTKADSLYKLLMQDSDNFIAEQLLLTCSEWKFGNMNAEKTIDYVLENLMADLPDEPKWVDGSGLSRYNLITPRSLVVVLNKIQQRISRERLFDIFPAGGVSGTIEKNYKNGDSPYVFAKTGTLRNNHCLSGYIKTGKGKLLIFSFMNNNYTTRTSAIKKEMEKVLRQVYATY